MHDVEVGEEPAHGERDGHRLGVLPAVVGRLEDTVEHQGREAGLDVVGRDGGQVVQHHRRVEPIAHRSRSGPSQLVEVDHGVRDPALAEQVADGGGHGRLAHPDGAGEQQRTRGHVTGRP